MTINLTDTAAAIVKADISAFKRDGKRYSDYVKEMGVTSENVADHVAIFRDAFKAACPKADGAQVKAYATKVRNGLNYHVGNGSEKKEATALITSLGAKSSLEDVVKAWKAAQN